MERAAGHLLGSIRPRLASQLFFFFLFLPTGCTIGSLVSGLGSVGRPRAWGSKKWALSPRIMPLFQLLWPGMPDFTGRYSSLCVNQSFARDPLGPAPHAPTPAPRDPTRSSDPPQTRSYKLIPGSNSPTSAQPYPLLVASRGKDVRTTGGALIIISNLRTLSILKLTNKQWIMRNRSAPSPVACRWKKGGTAVRQT